MSEEVHQQLGTVEKEQNFEELTVLRKIAMARVKKERDLAEVKMYSKLSLVQSTCEDALKWSSSMSLKTVFLSCLLECVSKSTTECMFCSVSIIP